MKATVLKMRTPIIRIGYSKGFKFNGRRSPVLDVVEGEIALARREGMKLNEFEKQERASTSTIRNWTNGTTKRPQFDKVAGVLDLLGLEVVLRRK
jgi:hypothetical protein